MRSSRQVPLAERVALTLERHAKELCELTNRHMSADEREAVALAIPILVQLLKGGHGASAAALAIDHLAVNSAANQNAIREAGAIAPLVALLQAGAGSEAAALRWRAELQSAREAAASGVAFEVEQRRLAEVKAAQDKEKRVEHLIGMAARRMGKKELASGWQAWSDRYHGGKRRHRMLAQAGARLARPKLAAGYSHWRIAWQLHQSREVSMSVAERYARDMEAARAEVEALRAEIDSARAAALAGLLRQEE